MEFNFTKFSISEKKLHPWQELALQTAAVLNDPAGLRFYFMVFKHGWHRRTDILKARDWVVGKVGKENGGRLFKSVYKKFL